jgi:hypothetical protein
MTKKEAEKLGWEFTHKLKGFNACKEDTILDTNIWRKSLKECLEIIAKIEKP